MNSLHSSLGIWIRWAVLTEAGFLGCWYAVQSVSTSASMAIGLPLAVLVSGAIWGASVGAAQWLELSRYQYRPKPLKWIFATSLGLLIGLTAGVLLSATIVREPLKAVPVERAISAILIGVGVGLGVGFFQSRILRLRGMSDKGWRLVNTLGMACGCLLGSYWAEFQAGGFGTSAGMLQFVLAAGLGLGVLSGWKFLMIARYESRPIEAG